MWPFKKKINKYLVRLTLTDKCKKGLVKVLKKRLAEDARGFYLHTEGDQQPLTGIYQRVCECTSKAEAIKYSCNHWNIKNKYVEVLNVTKKG